MKRITYTTTRMVLETPQEKALAKSWGSDWKRMSVSEDKQGSFLVIFGDWSGYKSSQYRITHTMLSPIQEEGFLGTVKFSDNTKMDVWTKRMTREELLEGDFRKMEGYESLIREFLKSGKKYYKV
jgi:hypothetical protein